MEKGTSEIAKLTERISKDPKSKLFVPLAEEYKKAGDIEMAMAVLTEGLRNNPGYITAKSFLGRLLLDKGNLLEAQKEFEEVIKAIPDNVLAQRKLGEIHALQGRAPEALQFFKAVLAINPKDPELKALVADLEAGRDVRERIGGPKYPPAAGQVAAVMPTPGPPPAAAPIQPVKPSAATAGPRRPQAAPASISPAIDADEPEEVLVFESLDDVVPLRQPEATHDMFAELASESNSEDAVRIDDGIAGGDERRPVSGKADPGNRFFDSEPTLIDMAADRVGSDATEASALSAPASGVGHDFDFVDAADKPAPVPGKGSAESVFSDDSSSESLFFDVEPVETEIEPQRAKGLEIGEKLTPGSIGPGDSMFPGEASSDSVLFDVEPTEASAQVSDNSVGVAPDDDAVPFGETLPEADDFTTDTLAELYIAQGFYEKAIEIYERMLADKPNSKLLKDKLANVRALGGASLAEEEQGTPVFFEASGPAPVPSSKPVSENGARQWNAPGVEAGGREYVPPPADDFESTAFDSGFAPLEYVMPGATGTGPPPTVEQEFPVREEEPQSASPKKDASGKEHTIVRLDNWLKNIMKEK